ncbi:MAG: hypothetical protein JW789_00575 [Candidatus Aenigmarchaeota archaeon]|nr:hypothetical protein [Candidatus Aenigmarchaeota archaeon]
MKIAIPLVENNGIESRIHPHFGHIQFIGVYNSSDKKFEIVDVKPTDGCSPVAAIENLKVDAIYTFGMGSRAIELCKRMKIKLKTGTFTTVKEVSENLDKLNDLEESCGH